MNLGGAVRLNKVGVAVVCGLIVIFILYMTPRGDNIDNNTKVNLKKLLQISIEAAERGGKEVVKVIQQANLKEESKGKTKEGVGVPVTNADYKSHCAMYYLISKNFPSVKVISEEKRVEEQCQPLHPLEIESLEKSMLSEDLSDMEVSSDQITVWIDPLDATKEYTENLHNYVTTMVCVALKGNPIIGIIHKPFGPEPKTSWVWVKKGMSPHLKNRKKKSDKTSVIISKSHPGNDIEKIVKNVFGENTEIIHAGGSGYKALEVAAGNVTAYLHSNYISKWDICAGDAIITGVGGTFTALNGDNIDYSATSGNSHQEGLLATMADHERYIRLFQGLP